MELTRRNFLTRSALIGCSAAASPLLTPVTLASAPWDGRIVVIILRGGMDGLDVVRPTGDPAFAALRPGLNVGEPGPDLDGFFSLHPALSPLLPLWQSEELGFFHAVSTPYRDKRSHFDGQDMLEAGTDTLLNGGVRDGWLNRMLQQVKGVHPRTAYAIGDSALRVLDGPAPVANWTPRARLSLSDQTLRLTELVMEEDAAMHAALAEAQFLSDETRPDRKGGRTHNQVARFAAEQLTGEARIAAFSLGGWDTHRAQHRGLERSLSRLSDTLLTLRDGLGPVIWGKTAVMALTEFGRTARENGTRGTDHGTAGLMLFAGGALRGGRVFGRWPGLDAADLYEQRDLMPTEDVRAPAAWIMRGLAGLGQTTLERHIFPGLRMEGNPRLLR